MAISCLRDGNPGRVTKCEDGRCAYENRLATQVWVIFTLWGAGSKMSGRFDGNNQFSPRNKVFGVGDAGPEGQKIQSRLPRTGRLARRTFQGPFSSGIFSLFYSWWLYWLSQFLECNSHANRDENKL